MLSDPLYIVGIISGIAGVILIVYRIRTQSRIHQKLDVEIAVLRGQHEAIPHETSNTAKSATIEMPRRNSSVDRTPDCAGTIPHAEATSEWWLIVKTGGVRYHPQTRLMSIDSNTGQWHGQVTIGRQHDDYGALFEIQLASATAEASQALQQYHEENISSGVWAGISSLPTGCQVHDSVAVTRAYAKPPDTAKAI